VLHLAFNMLAFVPIASSLERQLGTLQLLHLLLLLIIFGDIVYLSASYLAALVCVLILSENLLLWVSKNHMYA
jgi:rhomboid domain-containing protein 1